MDRWSMKSLAMRDYHPNNHPLRFFSEQMGLTEKVHIILLSAGTNL